MERQDTIRIAYIPVKGPAEVRTIPNTLEALQGIVGGYIEPLVITQIDHNPWSGEGPEWHTDELILICNEEGIPRGLRMNPWVPANDWGTIHGDACYVFAHDDEFVDVPRRIAENLVSIANNRKEVYHDVVPFPFD